MIIELRRYHLRPGSTEQMHARMRDALLPMFKASGVPTPRMIWEGTDADGAAVLSWIVEWESFEVRRATWTAVTPRWQQIKAERAEKEFVTRTELTLIDPWPSAPLKFSNNHTCCETAWHVRPKVGAGGDFRIVCLQTRFKLLRDAGATAISAADLVFGALPQSILFISWPDFATRAEGLAKLSALPPSLDMTDMVESQHWETLDRAPYLHI